MRSSLFLHRPGSPDPTTNEPHLSVSIRAHPWLIPRGAVRKRLRLSRQRHGPRQQPRLHQTGR